MAEGYITLSDIKKIKKSSLAIRRGDGKGLSWWWVFRT